MTDRPPRVVDRAERLLDDHTEPDHPRKYATTDAPATGEALVREQRAETADMGVLGTNAQSKGLVFGALVGGTLGALLFLPLGFISWGDSVSSLLRFVTMAAIGALAGASVGAVYWGGRLPELEGETVSADNTPGGGTSMRDPRTDDRGRPTQHPTGPIGGSTGPDSDGDRR